MKSEVQRWSDSYKAQIQDLQSRMAYPSNGYTECRETTEIRGAYLCLFDTQQGMNSALTRASMLIEGGGGGKRIVTQDDQEYQYMKILVGGHDLKGEDLLDFYAKASKVCENNNWQENYCFNSYEDALFTNFILPMAKSDPNFIVITFALQSSMNWQDVVTHEIMHAQYFNDLNFRVVVNAFWANMSEQEKKQVRDGLSQHYDSSNEFLVMNEFQAYMLMAGAERHLLGYLVPKYREPLMRAMEARGVRPVQVN